MLALMFDSRFKGMHIATKFFNSLEMALELVVEYDKKIFLFLLMKA
jgi:hypothetical protein